MYWPLFEKENEYPLRLKSDLPFPSHPLKMDSLQILKLLHFSAHPIKQLELISTSLLPLWVWTAPVAIDNSKLTPSITCNLANGIQLGIGKTGVICKALDQAGNEATCSFIVDIEGKWLKMYASANTVLLYKS